MRIHAVVFDFFGTLTIAATAAERYAGHREVAKALDIPVESYAAELQRSWEDRACGRLGDMTATLRVMARRCGVEPSAEQLAEATSARRIEQLRHVNFRPSAVPALRGLRERDIAVGLLSDCTHEIPEQWSTFAVAAPIQAPVFSVVEGKKKPDPELYRTVAGRLGVATEACLYVGDGDSRELPGATAVGMRAVRLRSDDHANAHVIDPIEWDGPQIADLSEVLALIDGDAT